MKHAIPFFLFICTQFFCQAQVINNDTIVSVLQIKPYDGSPPPPKQLLSAQTSQSSMRLSGTAPNFSTPDYVGSFSAQEQAVCQKAIDIWKLRLNGNPNVTIRTKFTKFAMSSDIGAKARFYCGTVSSTVVKTNTVFSPINRTDINYVAPLYITLNNSQTIPGQSNQQYELDVYINSNITSWYLDENAVGNCPSNMLDLLSAIIHEIGHSLGFASSYKYNETTGDISYPSCGYIYAYDN